MSCPDCQVLLIELEQIRRWVNINVSSNVALLNQVTEWVQETSFRPLLCDELFCELLTQKEAGTLTPENEALIKKAEPYLSQLIYAEWASESRYVSSNTGLRTLSEENFNNSPGVDTSGIIMNARNKAAYYRSKILIYLNENKDDYPLWCSKNCKKQSEKGFTFAAFGGRKKWF